MHNDNCDVMSFLRQPYCIVDSGCTDHWPVHLFVNPSLEEQREEEVFRAQGPGTSEEVRITRGLAGRRSSSFHWDHPEQKQEEKESGRNTRLLPYSHPLGS